MEPDRTPPPTRGKAYGAVSGVVAAALALGIAELVAALLPGTRSLVLAVGDAVIDSVPGWVERHAIAVLGTADKPVLIAGTLILTGVMGALLGMVAVRRPALGAAGVVLVVAIGVAAALADPRGNRWAPLLVGAIAASAGAAALLGLIRAAIHRPTAEEDVHTAPSRRRFMGLALLSAVAAVGSAAAGRMLVTRDQVEQIRASIGLPPAELEAPPPPPGADLEIPGLTPLYVPNEEFYRIDTALTVPQVEPDGWSLEITGMVDRPFSLSYQELLDMPHIEADVTLSCVSNEVGGNLVGNARWQGVPLHVLLDRAGVQSGATQVLGRSVDGFTAGFPTITALDVTESMVAVGMNGEPLPSVHGFPARLVVPGLYGYVSATKWLSQIVLTTFEDVEGYWIPRGWAREGPVKTQSRIDVPRSGTSLTPGLHPIAGVAWAPTRGIERVEVRIDDDPWEEAELAARLDVDCWRQWVLRWDATPGRHRITVRATDGEGEVQTDERTPVAPDGASGHHTIIVDVGE